MLLSNFIPEFSSARQKHDVQTGPQGVRSKGLVKKYWGGGPEQRGGGSSVFEPLVRGGSCNFQLPTGVGHPVFLWELAHI